MTKRKAAPPPPPEPEEPELKNALFRVRPEAKRAFDILRAEQGSRSGPRLIAEALDMLFERYGKPKIGFPSSVAPEFHPQIAPPRPSFMPQRQSTKRKA
jgi:hypothetical protein